MDLMANYLMLTRLTEQGIRDVKEAPTRIEAFKKQARSLGAEVREVYLSLGAVDTVCLISAPDDETICKVALALGGLGNVRTETLRMFSESEFKKLVGGLP
jgi:uncharacterized protein with GYD domain